MMMIATFHDTIEFYSNEGKSSSNSVKKIFVGVINKLLSSTSNEKT